MNIHTLALFISETDAKAAGATMKVTEKNKDSESPALMRSHLVPGFRGPFYRLCFVLLAAFVFSTFAENADPIVASVNGEWTKTTGLLIILKEDGSFSGKRGASKGKWQWLSTPDRRLEIVNGPNKDTLTLSADGKRMVGQDQTGGTVEYQKGDQREALTKMPVKPAEIKPAPTIERRGGDAVAGEIVRKYRNSFVFLNGTNGSGSGFIAELAGANFLFTNAHVVAGVEGVAFKTLDGAPIQNGAASVAVGHDIFRIQLAGGGKPFEVMQEVDGNASIGDEIVVLGNSGGAGVISPVKGKIVGVGPNLVEVDAPFIPGNSGSPIIHIKSGKVIGVATYLIVKSYDEVQLISGPLCGLIY